MSYPFPRVPLIATGRVRDSVTDTMLSDGGEFHASPYQAAGLLAIGSARLRYPDDVAMIAAVAIYADDPAIVRHYEYRAEQALVEAWRRGMRPDLSHGDF